MKKIITLAIAGSLLAGCANQGGKLRADSKLIQENEHRLASLEESINALNSQVAQLNSRVYEVRTKNGQKTSMTVVPVVKNTPAPVAAPAPQPAHPVHETMPAQPAALPAESTQATATRAQVSTPQAAATPAQPRQPAGRRIDPRAKPGPLPAKAKAAAAAPAQPKDQPASGSIGAPATPAASLVEPGLPPAELPAESIPPVPQGNVTPVPKGDVPPQMPPIEEAPAIPLPVAPVSDLALPPEQAQASASVPEAPKKAPASPRKAAPAVKGEQAAYNAALNAARSGRTAEGIRLFRDFLQKYPNGPYAANAEYWIGECLYSQGKYKDALSEFQSVNNSYPAHHKNADALLKAGITLGKMGDKAGAAEKFRTLIANFPNSEAARRARAMGAN